MSRINALSINPGRVPEAAELILGQLAVNAADGRIYLELVSGLIICVGADITQFATSEDVQNIDLSAYALQTTVTQALTGLAQQLGALSQALSGKAPTVHGHAIADVVQLGDTLSTMQGQINGKQPTGNYAAAAHSHPIDQVDGLQTAINNIIATLQTKQPAGNYQPAGSYAGATGVPGNFTANVLLSSNHIQAGAGTSYRIGTDVVMRVPNRNGWQQPTGPRATGAFNTSAVTLNELAKRVASMIDELRWHGILSQYGTTI